MSPVRATTANSESTRTGGIPRLWRHLFRFAHSKKEEEDLGLWIYSDLGIRSNSSNTRFFSGANMVAALGCLVGRTMEEYRFSEKRTRKNILRFVQLYHKFTGHDVNKCDIARHTVRFLPSCQPVCNGDGFRHLVSFFFFFFSFFVIPPSWRVCIISLQCVLHAISATHPSHHPANQLLSGCQRALAFAQTQPPSNPLPPAYIGLYSGALTETH